MKKILITLAILLLILSGCVMTTKYHITDSPLLQYDDSDGIEVQCLYLDREAITKRHNYKGNPFLAPEMVFTPTYSIIFELKIKNKENSPVKLDIRDIEFYYNDRRYRATSKSQIEDKINEYSRNGTDRLKQKRIAKAFMLGDIRTIPGNGEVKAYLVFMSSFPDRGEGELILPFKSQDGINITDFSFNYNFQLKR